MFELLKRWTRTDHEACQENLSAFLDGRLTSGERSKVERHLEECESCRADLNSLRETVGLLRALPVIQPPHNFFIPASESVRLRQTHQHRISYGYLQMATAVATILLVLVVSGDALLRFQPAMPLRMVSQALPAPTLSAADESVASSAAPNSFVAGKAADTAPAAESVAAAQPAPQALAVETATASQDAALLNATGATEEAVEPPAAAPSQTFAKSAGALAGPTGAGTPPVVPPPPGEATPEPSATATSVPPTATLLPTPLPTLTPVPSTPTSPPYVVDTRGPDLAQPAGPSGTRAFLEALRPFLPWLEGILSLTLVLLLVTLRWLRRALYPA